MITNPANNSLQVPLHGAMSASGNVCWDPLMVLTDNIEEEEKCGRRTIFAL